MGMNDLLAAFNLIEKKRNPQNSFFSGPVKNELIHKAEILLGISFPKTYREFLMEYGCGDINGDEFYGIINDNFYCESLPNLIWITLKYQNDWNFPKYLMIISSTGDGFYYALDSSSPNKDGEYPVVIYYGFDGPNDYEKVNEDFGEFLLEQVTQALEDEEDKEE